LTSGIRVSIATPSLNQGKYLPFAIESVLAQAGPEADYWVIDGGSSDCTLEVLKQCSPKVQWISESDQGQADAIQKGFQRAKGEVLGWLNADDLLLPGTLETVQREFADNPNLMLLYGDACHIDATGQVLEEYPTADFILENLAFHCFICQPACFFRRSLWEAAGGLDSSLHCAMDLDLWIRFGKLQRQHPSWQFRRIRQTLAYSRMHTKNKTLSLRTHCARETISLARRHFGQVPFNLVYNLVEGSTGKFDGFFRRSPFSLLIFLRSFGQWCRENSHSPWYLAEHILRGLCSPIDSLQRISRRVRNKTFPGALFMA
jgi:glycosyltransferase involved in cell wall biosynthesis